MTSYRKTMRQAREEMLQSLNEHIELDEALSSKDQKAIEDYVSKFESLSKPKKES